MGEDAATGSPPRRRFPTASIRWIEMREATTKMRVPVGSPIILRTRDKTLSHSVRYAPARKPSFPEDQPRLRQ